NQSNRCKRVASSCDPIRRGPKLLRQVIFPGQDREEMLRFRREAADRVRRGSKLHHRELP
ncbi:MAG TPA: hypothetical protein VJM80_08855, partial [bacterium]|nr:hypothetical protein [bacterium]